jgi:CelD/BcsL family acetyltransferase involved in cellulose biosynthesis
MLASEVITELSKLDPLQAEWDELAVASQLPLMSPACVMAWWRHLAPPAAEPRMVAVRDDGTLVGLAPFYVDLAGRGGRLGLRLPGIELAAGLAPLAAPGHRQAVAGALAEALADSSLCPDLVALEGMPLVADWARTLREAWPGRRRPASRRYQVSGCPTVSLQETSFDAWLSAKSSSFRREMRRARRQFTAAGGTTRSSTLDTLRSDIDVFVRLHGSRWEDRGGSSFVGLGARLPAVLNDIGQTLLNQEGRFRLRLLEVEGEPISAQLFLAAGPRVLYVNAGWDDRFANLKPSAVGLLAVIEDAFERGEDRVDLGLGEQRYKLRFADGNDPVAWTILIPAGMRLPVTLLRTAPMRGRATLKNMLKRRLSEKQIIKLRQSLRKLGAQ